MLKVTLKGLAAHKLRFVLTAVAVTIGVAFLSGTLVFTDTIRQTFDDLFASIYKNTDAVVRGPTAFETNFGDQRPRVPASTLAQVSSVPGVKAAEGQIQINYAQIVDANGDPIGNPGRGAPALGFAWGNNPELNNFNIASGRPPRADDEIVIDKRSASKGNLHVGDRVDVLTVDPPQPYKIVGIARFGTADSPAGASVVLFTPAQAQKVAHAAGQFDSIAVVGQPGLSQETLKARLQESLALGNYEVLTGKEVTKESQDLIGKQLGFFKLGLTIFAFIALVVAIFIIYNTFTIIVAQRTRELALLRAIGASGRQVLLSVLGESLVVGLLASGLGILGGILVSGLLKGLLALVGIDIPSGGIVVQAEHRRHRPRRRRRRHDPLRDPPRVEGGAHPTDRGVARCSRSSVRPRCSRARSPGCSCSGSVSRSLFVGVFTDIARRFVYVGAGAVLVFAGAIVLTPLFARWPRARTRRTAARDQGHDGDARARTRLGTRSAPRPPRPR